LFDVPLDPPLQHIIFILIESFFANIGSIIANKENQSTKIPTTK